MVKKLVDQNFPQ